jgi:hypothetical protein
MPIREYESLSMKLHVVPVLMEAGYVLKQNGDLDWYANGIPVAVCNSSELWTTDRAIAEVLLEKCRPFGKELVINVRR